MNIGTSVLAGPPQSRMSEVARERQPGRQQQSGNRSQVSFIAYRCPSLLIETVLNRHLSLISLDLGLIIMKLKSNPPWWILFTTISLVSCFRYAFLFSK